MINVTDRPRKNASKNSDPAVCSPPDNGLELSIGREVKRFRAQLGVTVADLAKQAGLSVGMLSKIENGQTSPSLATINAVALALNVPVTSLFRSYEEQRDITVIKSGEGLLIERRGTRAGHQYQLLGHMIGKPYSVEPYVISLSDESDVFPIFQHPGVEFLYMLEGEVAYRHGEQVYHLVAGDSMFFDSEAPHGPETLVKLPIRYVCVIVSLSEKS